ncbi:PIN domain-containing protein [Flavobacterium phragmitis]|uniref:PIN like domain-containing protein n=1 Tax=Flavobacterium phragmitis TaxID=739143 RepID=A0A1I1V717_9FLAO|nr:PIN domain-containing protein [Flavobacterium phragmitis]SFD76130.1 hypothetical protein SAMN05216297_111268 [Flavobacterium phragmitis]
MSDKNHFYLDKVFPEADKIFSFQYEALEKIDKNCIFILDTNVLFVPFDASEKSTSEIKEILKKLKDKNKLFIPARVAREFANNRAKRIGDLFLKVRQTKENLNSGPYKLDDYPLLEGNSNYKSVKDKFSQISSLIKESRNLLDNIETDIKTWNWDDAVSKIYKEIFTADTIIEVQKTESEIIKDLQFRIDYKIAPGFKDSAKIDDGIGDLIIWTTVLEIAKSKKTDIVFVSNDQKNDWFYKQDKIGLYPRFELFDEFRRFTDGKTIHIINFPKFLELRKAKTETINDVKQTIARNTETHPYSRNHSHSDLAKGMVINHRRFGPGIVNRLYHSAAGKEWVEIEFENGSIKHLILKLSDLYIPQTPLNIVRKWREKNHQQIDLFKNEKEDDNNSE